MQHTDCRSREERTERVTAMEKFFERNCIRGYHVYKKVWAATVGEALVCEREPKLSSDRYAVAVKNKGTIIEHLPRKLLHVCSLFCDGEVRNSKCERQTRAHGMPRSITCIVIIRCRRHFMRLIFVALCENFQQRKFPDLRYVLPHTYPVILEVGGGKT